MSNRPSSFRWILTVGSILYSLKSSHFWQWLLLLFLCRHEKHTAPLPPIFSIPTDFFTIFSGCFYIIILLFFNYADCIGKWYHLPRHTACLCCESNCNQRHTGKVKEGGAPDSASFLIESFLLGNHVPQWISTIINYL